MTLSRCAVFVYRLALRALPPAHRAEYGEATIDTFKRELAARQTARGRMSGLRFSLAACLDALGAAPASTGFPGRTSS